MLYIHKTRNDTYRVLLSRKVYKKRRVGTFPTVEEAIRRRDEKLLELGYKVIDDKLHSLDSVPENAEPKIEKSERLNTATVESVGRITTADQLLKVADVDLDIWHVERQVVNKWEVGAKDDNGEVQVSPLIQVKLWLARKKPIKLWATVEPIRCDPKSYENKPRYGKTRRAMIIADPQIGFRKDLRNAKLTPFHDRRVLDVALSIAKQLDDINILLWAGDLEDLPEWTDKFLRSPEFAQTTQPTINETHWWLSQFADYVENQVILAGNHEARMDNAIITHLRAAYDLRPADELDMPPSLSIQRLLALDKLQIKYIPDYPDGEFWLNDKLRVIHGDKARQPGSTGRQVASDNDASTIYGHIHRPEIVTRLQRVRGGKNQIMSVCPGCACRIDNVVPGQTSTQNWAQGILLVDYDETHFTPTIIRVDEGRAVYDRHCYTAKPELVEGALRASYPDWNW